MKHFVLSSLLTSVFSLSAFAEVHEVAHYSLKGGGGIRDTAAPDVWQSLAHGGPDLACQGSLKVMSSGPEARRQEYDSTIKFEEPNQCYAVAKNLVGGDNFVVEAWAYPLKGNDGGWHAVVANGNGANGFLIGQSDNQWAVLVGSVGGVNLGAVQPESWTHLAIVKSGGSVSGWLNGIKVCALPDVGGGAPNFSIGATAPNNEAFAGWIAEVRYSTFKPGQFDPTEDFLLDTKQLKDVTVDVHYEIYQGLPVIMKTFTVHNRAVKDVVLTQFEGEHLAVQPTVSRLLHVESDYSFALANATDKGSSLGIHMGGRGGQFRDYNLGGGTTRFVRDPDWRSMATFNQAEDLFLEDPQSGLLLSRPTVGPNWSVKPNQSFDAFRTFEILNDTSERERYFLAQRQFYKKLAPQSTEHQLQVLAPNADDLNTLAPLMDQMAECGFELLQAPAFTGSFSHSDSSAANIDRMKLVCDYAKTKGIRVGAYELMMASRGWGSAEDHFNCVDPATKRPGSMFGQSACGASAWADMYGTNLWQTIEGAGMGAFMPDGPYHGDCCAATDHPHHKGLEDSQWAQWKWMCQILHEGQRRNLYLPVPDWYFLNGQSVTGMGFREAVDNIDIVLQTVICRQYVYDGTWHKIASMGGVNVNTRVLPGGMEQSLDKYERQFFGLLSSGAAVSITGHRLYDGPNSRAMLRKWMDWYRRYRAIIQGDIIHLRRPDGRDLDYTLHVNPAGREKGMLLVFNPLDEVVKRELVVPLYYTGPTATARIREQEGQPQTYQLDRGFNVRVPLTIPTNGYSWFIIE